MKRKISRLAREIDWALAVGDDVSRIIGELESLINDTLGFYNEVASRHTGWMPSTILVELEQARGVAKMLVSVENERIFRIIAFSLIRWISKIKDDIAELDRILPTTTRTNG